MAVPESLDVNGLTGRVILRGQPGYDAARQGRNSRLSASPAAVVFCRSAADVAHAIAWAKKRKISLRARCGRHSYEGYSLVDDGLVVDVSDINSVVHDASQKTARVGAGVRLLDLYETLWRDHRTVPAGSCATVGIAGLTLGGGYGLLARHLGLTCDNLLSVEMVMADGQLSHANEREHADLLWACRGGGGGNFGIATAFTFRVHPIDRVAVYALTWDWSDLEAVLRAWQAWAPRTDGRLTCLLKLHSRRDGTISSVGQFVGPEKELAALLTPLQAAGTPFESTVETISYWDAVQRFAGLGGHKPVHGGPLAVDQTQFKGSSDYANRPLSREAIGVIRHFLETAPSATNLVQLENYGGAINKIAPASTAFPHRTGTLFSLQYQAYWKPGAGEAANMAWVKQFRQAMQPFVSGGAYSNYCDQAIADWPRAYYGANFARLTQIKAKYDPDNFFRFPQSIPPAGP